MRRVIAVLGLTLLTACGPMGIGPFDGGASSSFSTIAPSVGGDQAAQSLLFGAWVATSASSSGGFHDVSPGTLRAFDPTLKVVGDAPAKVGVISLNHAGADGVVFSTGSATGHVFCLVATPEGVPKTGSVDAQGATSGDDCTGKAWTPGE